MIQAKKVHFIGIGGYGISALARLLLEMGFQVSGSDLNSSEITRRLEKMGAKIFIGHSKENIQECDLVVYSTAIPDYNCELIAAKEKGIAFHRSELLAHFINNKKGIAITGAHGKTTTTTMLALILEESGMDPTALIGGDIDSFTGTARLGKGEYVIAEACESDQSFTRYKPWGAIVTNIEADHLEHYQGDFQNLLDGYAVFLSNINPQGILVYPKDDQWTEEVLPKAKCLTISFGLNQGYYRAEAIELLPRGSRFQLVREREILGEVILNVPGLHNVANAVAAAAMALELGAGMEAVQWALRHFKGAKRRFQVLYDEEVTIIDDYAHHPTEIQATLAAAKGSCRRRLIAVFQPHRYTRTMYFAEEFANSFKDADIVFVDRIYAASEEPIPGIDSDGLAAKIQANNPGKIVEPARGTKLIGRILRLVQPGDTVLTMGAGDISMVSHELARLLQIR